MVNIAVAVVVVVDITVVVVDISEQNIVVKNKYSVVVTLALV